MLGVLNLIYRLHGLGLWLSLLVWVCCALDRKKRLEPQSSVLTARTPIAKLTTSEAFFDLLLMVKILHYFKYPKRWELCIFRSVQSPGDARLANEFGRHLIKSGGSVHSQTHEGSGAEICPSLRWRAKLLDAAQDLSPKSAYTKHRKAHARSPRVLYRVVKLNCCGSTEV